MYILEWLVRGPTFSRSPRCTILPYKVYNEVYKSPFYYQKTWYTNVQIMKLYFKGNELFAPEYINEGCLHIIRLFTGYTN